MNIIRFKSGALSTNSYIVVNENKGAIIIDPGFAFDDQLKYLKNYNLKVLGIFLTHGHFDHVFGVSNISKITGSKTYMSKYDLNLLEKMNLYCYVYEKLTMPMEIPIIDNDVLDGDEFSFEGFKIKVIMTPGHTPGSVCYLLGENLFTGDLFEDTHINNRLIPGVDINKVEISREKIIKMDNEINIQPGHGPSFKIKNYRHP